MDRACSRAYASVPRTCCVLCCLGQAGPCRGRPAPRHARRNPVGHQALARIAPGDAWGARRDPSVRPLAFRPPSAHGGRRQRSHARIRAAGGLPGRVSERAGRARASGPSRHAAVRGRGDPDTAGDWLRSARTKPRTPQPRRSVEAVLERRAALDGAISASLVLLQSGRELSRAQLQGALLLPPPPPPACPRSAACCALRCPAHCAPRTACRRSLQLARPGGHL